VDSQHLGTSFKILDQSAVPSGGFVRRPHPRDRPPFVPAASVPVAGMAGTLRRSGLGGKRRRDWDRARRRV
jgi:hypothetical protein